MIELRLPPHAEWIEALLAPDVAVVAEELGLGAVVAHEQGRAVLAHDDSAAVERLVAQLAHQH